MRSLSIRHISPPNDGRVHIHCDCEPGGKGSGRVCGLQARHFMPAVSSSDIQFGDRAVSSSGGAASGVSAGAVGAPPAD
eukprot:2331373-Prymnesium_polylepis.2